MNPWRLTDIESEFVAVSVFLHGGTSPVASLFVDSFFTMPVETATHRMLKRDEVARELTAGFSDTRAIILHEGLSSLCRNARHR